MMDLWTASKINASQYTTQAVMAVLFGLTIAKGDLAHT